MYKPFTLMLFYFTIKSFPLTSHLYITFILPPNIFPPCKLLCPVAIREIRDTPKCRARKRSQDLK